MAVCVNRESMGLKKKKKQEKEKTRRYLNIKERNVCRNRQLKMRCKRDVSIRTVVVRNSFSLPGYIYSKRLVRVVRSYKVRSHSECGRKQQVARKTRRQKMKLYRVSSHEFLRKGSHRVGRSSNEKFP